MTETKKETENRLPHRLHLEDRRTLTVSGVSDVDSFDETATVLHTTLGDLTVKGEDLHINSLNVETGDLTLEGSIRELIYTESRARTGGFFGKLFR